MRCANGGSGSCARQLSHWPYWSSGSPVGPRPRPKPDQLRHLITTYNADDCAALKVVVDALYAIRDGAPGNDVVDAGSVKPQSLGKFRKNVFVLPDLELINNCAYFNYQRERILSRTSPTVRKALRRERRAAQRKPRVNHVVTMKPPRMNAVASS